MRTCWASAIAFASNVQRRLESPEAWIAHICKSKHPLINAMLRRYRFLNRNVTFHHFDVLVGCLFSFADIVVLNKKMYISQSSSIHNVAEVYSVHAMVLSGTHMVQKDCFMLFK